MSGRLADRLSATGGDNVVNGLVCYIVAGDVEKVVTSWLGVVDDVDSPASLQELVEVLVLVRGAGQARGIANSNLPGGHLSEALAQYATLLAGQGSLATALSYLEEELVGEDQQLQDLRERVQKAFTRTKQAAPVVAPEQPRAAQLQPLASSLGAMDVYQKQSHEHDLEDTRDFFSLIETQQTDDQANVPSEFLQSNILGESESYTLQLLASIKNESSSFDSVNLVCEDSQVVTLPMPVLSLALPEFGNAIMEAWSCGYEVNVSVPFKSEILMHLKELIFGGSSSGVSSENETLLLCFLREVGFNCSIERHLVKSAHDAEEDTVIIGDMYDSDESELNDNESEENNYEQEKLGQSSIKQFWPRKISIKSVTRKVCSSLCRNDCYKVSQTWSKDNKEMLKGLFKSVKVSIVKDKMLSHIVNQGNVGLTTDNYVIHGSMFCYEYLSVLTGCTVYLLKSVLEDYWKGIRLYEHGNRGIMKNPSVATVTFICWFKNFLSLYGQAAPTDQVIVVNYWLKGKVLFKMYQVEAPSPHIELTTFYKHLKTYFGPKRIDRTLPCYRISKYSSHSICDQCVALNANQKLCKTEAELEMTKGLRNQHKMEFGMARRAVESLRQSAIDFPSDVLFLQIDGMDNSKVWNLSLLPHTNTN